MRVSLVIPGWPREQFANGIVTAASHLLESLAGVDVDVRALAWEGHPDPDGCAPRVAVIPPARKQPGLAHVGKSIRWRLDFGRTGRTQAAKRIADLLEELDSGSPGDVLEAEEAQGWLAELTRVSAVTTVAALHGPWFLHGPLSGQGPASRGYRARVRAEGQALRAADLILAPSQDVLRRAIRYYDLGQSRSCVVPYAFPVRDPQERWSRGGCEPEHVLFVGRFDRHKGGDIAIQAFSMVARRRRRVRLTFVGPDPGVADDRGRICSLKEFAERCLPGCIASGQISWKGQRGPDEIDRLRIRAAVTLSCSRWENLSLAVLEAMASGCPVIVADKGGLSEHVQDGMNGILFESGNATHLATCIDRVLDDPGLGAALGRAAAELVAREFDPVKVAGQRLAAYRQAVQAHRAGRVR